MFQVWEGEEKESAGVLRNRPFFLRAVKGSIEMFSSFPLRGPSFGSESLRKGRKFEFLAIRQKLLRDLRVSIMRRECPYLNWISGVLIDDKFLANLSFTLFWGSCLILQQI